MLASGVGSMPGQDHAEALQVVLGEVGDLPFLPELPARGPHAGMVGRAMALLAGLPADLQPEGWRLTGGDGIDQRRARSLLAQDLDTAEELAGAHRGPFKVQVAGPLTLAASVERPRGDKVLGDHGARRDLADSLAEGVADHVADLRRRLPHADLVVQVDEPGVTAVLQGRVPTASGYSRHRTVHPPEADALLRPTVEAITAGGARPVVHSCAPDVPVALLRGAGFGAVSFDATLADWTPDVADVWSEAFEAGVDLWPGVVPSTQRHVTDAALQRRMVDLFARLGFGEDTWRERSVVTPTCGLAGASPAWARQALTLAHHLTERPDEEG